MSVTTETTAGASQQPNALTNGLSPRQVRLAGFGGALSTYGSLVQPQNREELLAALEHARSRNLMVTMRGAAQSYGDANIGEELVIDLTKMNRILGFDQETGVLTCEPGVTVRDAWQFGVPLGYWPPIVSGTMRPTLGGALAMNIHGKNHYASGSLGDHITEFTFVTVEGESHTCSREHNRDLFFAIPGSAGLLGIFTEIKLKLKRVHSGYVQVEEEISDDLAGTFELMRKYEGKSEYVVGWLDGFAGGKGLGRSVIHAAKLLPPGVDSDPGQSLSLDSQDLPPYIMGVFPKAWVWFFLQFFSHNPGMRLVNLAKYHLSRLTGAKTYLQSHAGFHFLLDYVPNWNWAYGRSGLIQYQAFVPKENAEEAFREIIEIHQRWGQPSYLLVTKRHRPDEFLFGCNLDGYSMAMDFPAKDRQRLWAMCADMDEVVINAGGKFYLAKDATLRAGQLERAYGKAAMDRFWELKGRLDPRNRLQTAQSQRLSELSDPGSRP